MFCSKTSRMVTRALPENVPETWSKQPGRILLCSGAGGGLAFTLADRLEPLPEWTEGDRIVDVGRQGAAEAGVVSSSGSMTSDASGCRVSVSSEACRMS